VKRRNTVQTRLTDFIEPTEGKKVNPPRERKTHPVAPKEHATLWEKQVHGPRNNWGVCNFDGTVVFAQIVRGRMHVHGREASCRWCEGPLEIRGDKVFCVGTCQRYQGEFSRDLDAYLRWEGAKSYTLRKEVADTEGLNLEPRDLEPISYAPNWSVLYEYMANQSPEADEAPQNTPRKSN